MNTATLERASLLRRLADALPAMGGYTLQHVALLREMADEQQGGSRRRAGEQAQGSEYGFGSALHAAAKRSGVTDEDVDALLAAMHASPARQPAEPMALP